MLNLKKIISFGVLFSSAIALLPLPVAHAYQTKNLVISAYYSPLPNQNRYAMGSYEADIRMNGNGTNGADGTPVYVGMLAAPKSYAFGTQVFIPGLGTGTVHDRGGAIQAYDDYDRIDVWMGSGEEGLVRALQWGMRKIEGKVYSPGAGLSDNIYLAEVIVPAYTEKRFTAGIGANDSGDHVTSVQQGLVSLGLLADTEVTGTYDDATMEAVYNLQKDAKLIGGWSDYGAGYFGNKTADLMEEKLKTVEIVPQVVTEENVDNCLQDFCANLAEGDSSDEVKKLQDKLAELGHLASEGITGNYGTLTRQAVFEFQKANGVLTYDWEAGAGVFGPSTRAALNKKLKGEEGGHENISINFFAVDLKSGDTGGEVRKVQQFLREEGFFDGEAGGLYGQITKDAVLKFQMRESLAGGADSVGAGEWGPLTRARANQVVRMNNLGIPILNGVEKEQAPFAVLVGRLSSDTLSSGDKGVEVEKLQHVLAKLEYLKVEPTGYFGDSTHSALVKFQVEQGIIPDEKAADAGIFGKKTRSSLAQVAQ